MVAPGSPAYAAGLDQDDTVLQFAGERVTSAETINTALSRHRPGGPNFTAGDDAFGRDRTVAPGAHAG